MNGHADRALQCARFFRRLGLCPLPSRMDRKGPALPSYAEYWDAPVPDEVYTADAWQTTNIQLMTGARTPGPTKIVVVDCDGDEAIATWNTILAHHGHRVTRSWVAVTGSGGTHHYFRLPDGLDSCPSGMLWGVWDTWGDDGKGRWAKHKEVRLLGDHALVIAPPSLHVATGRPYAFVGNQSPRTAPLPEIAPDWLLALPRLAAPRCIEVENVKIGNAAYKGPGVRSGAFYGRAEVLSAIADKIALAKSWGLAFDRDQPNANGWASCFVPGREDPRSSRPSGSFHAADGTLQDRKDLSTISLFDLGALLQPAAYPTWRECRDALGDQFLGRPTSPYREALRTAGYTGRP